MISSYEKEREACVRYYAERYHSREIAEQLLSHNENEIHRIHNQILIDNEKEKHLKVVEIQEHGLNLKKVVPINE